MGSAAAPCLGAAKGQFHGNIAGAQHMQETDYVAMADKNQNNKTSVWNLLGPKNERMLMSNEAGAYLVLHAL